MNNVIKRDGTVQVYDPTKLETAVMRAFGSVDIPVPSGFMECLEGKMIALVDDTHIESIQDIIQNTLIEYNLYEVVESFILYRKKREEVRESKSQLIKDITKAISASDVQNQNANVDEHSFSGRIGEAAAVATKNAALKMMSKRTRRNHENNVSYVHDLDNYAVGSHNCLTLPFEYLSSKSIHTRQVDIRPAASFNTAAQLLAVYFQIQSQNQFGGVSEAHLDWSMVPYVRRSFMKHYVSNWIKVHVPEFYADLDVISMSYEEIKKRKENAVVRFFTETGLINVDDFYFDNDALDSTLKRQSIYDTQVEVYQGCEGLYHNLNSMQSRAGAQVAFSSVNFGTCTLPEGRMVIKNMLEVCYNGLGPKAQTSIFPCVIFQWKKGINTRPGEPNYDMYMLAAKCTGKRLYPNYANCDWSVQKDAKKYDVRVKNEVLNGLSDDDYSTLFNILKDDPDTCVELGLWVQPKTGRIYPVEVEVPNELFSTMGCRTSNGADINFVHSFRKNIESVLSGGGIVDRITSACIKDGRGNIAPQTIIMPTVAMMTLEKMYKGKYNDYTELITLAHGDTDNVKTEFLKMLDRYIGETKDSLLDRYAHIASQSPKAAEFMYANGTMYGYHESEGIQSALRHGTLVIGQIGLSETLRILLGYDQTSDDGMEYAKQIESLFNTRAGEYKQQYSLNFGVYYTPAENLCYTSMRKFKGKYGVISGVSDHEFFTNSIHVPVYTRTDAFTKIDIESQLTGYSNAGCITYVELDGKAKWNPEAIMEINNYAMEHDIPYMGFNMPNDQCQECGDLGDFEDDVCPVCGSMHIKRLARVTGYLSTDYRNFNLGKQKEVEERVDHINKEEYGHEHR